MQDGSSNITQDDDADKTYELPILKNILSKRDKNEIPKQLEFFEGGQNGEIT